MAEMKSKHDLIAKIAKREAPLIAVEPKEEGEEERQSREDADLLEDYLNYLGEVEAAERESRENYIEPDFDDDYEDPFDDWRYEH